MALHIHLRFYEELNEFLPPERKKRRFALEVNERATVGELLASLGVPDDQAELVLVNGDSVDFSHRFKDGDFVSVYRFRIVRCKTAGAGAQGHSAPDLFSGRPGPASLGSLFACHGIGCGRFRLLAAGQNHSYC